MASRVAETVRQGAADTRHLVMGDSNAGNTRLLTILVLLVGLIAVANLIVCAVILNQPGQPRISLAPTINSMANPITKMLEDAIKKAQQQEMDALQQMQQGGAGANTGSKTKRSIHFGQDENVPVTAVGKKIYTIQYGHDFGAYEYIKKDGHHAGFLRDLAYEVCEAAHVDCRLVYDAYSNCLTKTPRHPPRGGQGLLGGWYDGCMGWAPTVDRVHIFDFSDAFTNLIKSQVYAKKGSKVEGKNLKGKKIGFVSGWAEDEGCMSRVGGIDLDEEQVSHFVDPKALLSALKKGDVDVAFGNEAAFGMEKDLEYVPGLTHSCSMSGLSLMGRKDNGMMEWWNKGLQKVKESGKLQRLCNEASKIHGARGLLHCNGL